jgi:hypothetical protein
MARDPVIELVTQAYSAAGPLERTGKWVMDRPWYDRLRAAACTEEQERARAREHADIRIDPNAWLPGRCPVCMAGPFADMKAFTDHVSAMADPANREPDPRDQLFGIPMEVREDGGEPHLASTQPSSPFGR